MPVLYNLKPTTDSKMTTAAPILMTSINPAYTFPDSDGDGIEDRWDTCIDEPENYNDYLDHDGCP